FNVKDRSFYASLRTKLASSDQHDTINDNKTGNSNDSNAVTIEENNVGANIEF
ncbi:14563_t:CDS:1, partial [Dentiscutata heterogama]